MHGVKEWRSAGVKPKGVYSVIGVVEMEGWGSMWFMIYYGGGIMREIYEGDI